MAAKEVAAVVCFFTVNGESHVERSEGKHVCLVHFWDFLICSMKSIETIIAKFYQILTRSP